MNLRLISIWANNWTYKVGVKYEQIWFINYYNHSIGVL